MLEIGQVIGKPIIVGCLILAGVNGVIKASDKENGTWSDAVVAGLSITSMLFIGWI